MKDEMENSPQHWVVKEVHDESVHDEDKLTKNSFRVEAMGQSTQRNTEMKNNSSWTLVSTGYPFPEIPF